MSDIVDDNRESLKAIISAFSFGLRFQNLGKYEASAAQPLRLPHQLAHAALYTA